MSRLARFLERHPRPTRGRVLGGVCVMLGERWGIDPIWIRLGFLALALAKGVGLVLYLLLWLALPTRGERLAGGGWRDATRERLASAGAELKTAKDEVAAGWRRLDRQPSPLPLSRRWLAIGGLAGGATLLLATFGAFDWLTPLRALGVALLAFGVGVLTTTRPPDAKRRRR
ncbi:MAG TPA: PspC domain-containing protein [Polyangiaceae bacterium LLY-WYZ-15_(1-7)]|nr:hypothetical protein [Sandaracinus sp.]HJL02860.1 PspC domain-containing protein [Polyangiaceae bacterium LLY-WYZ-15_(1-7)]HJL12188.1 PspC domain-containing protein [Polyangiaceae bacterium LLY-WYZ-15_(1-7)]HJL24364.1 PspC domain-containing protein [Polyangiaceae bacterium LLY-WYZ-15_(1-7)]HJL36813.1 PspC domain-containing protein [Polyangiaceae bacterium LLY-WYZ-15_(1-7)]